MSAIFAGLNVLQGYRFLSSYDVSEVWVGRTITPRVLAGSTQKAEKWRGTY